MRHPRRQQPQARQLLVRHQLALHPPQLLVALPRRLQRIDEHQAPRLAQSVERHRRQAEQPHRPRLHPLPQPQPRRHRQVEPQPHPPPGEPLPRPGRVQQHRLEEHVEPGHQVPLQQLRLQRAEGQVADQQHPPVHVPELAPPLRPRVDAPVEPEPDGEEHAQHPHHRPPAPHVGQQQRLGARHAGVAPERQAPVHGVAVPVPHGIDLGPLGRCCAHVAFPPVNATDVSRAGPVSCSTSPATPIGAWKTVGHWEGGDFGLHAVACLRARLP